jgi:hypothetical protein
MSAIILLILRFALAVCLYAFLGWALFTIWRALKNQEAQLTISQAVPIRLTFLVDEEVKEIHLSKSEVVLGRDPGCDCIPAINSLEQACLPIFSPSVVVAGRLSSTNGTFKPGAGLLSIGGYQWRQNYLRKIVLTVSPKNQ